MTMNTQSHREETIYDIDIYHGAPHGRRAVIYEWRPNGEAERLVADFLCITTDESDWLEHFGRRPYRAFRRLTSVDPGGELEEVTHHNGCYQYPPGVLNA